MITPIQPVPAYPAEAVSIKIDDVHLTLGTAANCQWKLLDAEGNLVSVPSRAALTEEQYAGWGDDDNYFANCIIENLGLVRGPDPVVEAGPEVVV